MDNLNSALGTWNGKLAEIWTLLSTSPENFKGGAVWSVMRDINGALQAIGCALLVLFFVMGIVKTCSSFTELKKPEMVFKCFIRFVLAQAAVTHGMELMTALFKVAQGMISTIMTASGMSALTDTTLPDEMVTIIEDVGFLESIPLWAITLLGSLFIWVLSLIMILTVYSRFFKLYLATAIAPIPMASFAGQPSSSIGVAFLKTHTRNFCGSTGLVCAVLLDGTAAVGQHHSVAIAVEQAAQILLNAPFSKNGRGIFDKKLRAKCLAGRKRASAKKFL